MGCCLVFVVLAGAPRFALFLMWLFTDRLQLAFDSFLVGFLGFVFLPFTAVMWAAAYDPIYGVRGIGWFLVILGFLLDLSVTFGGGRAERQRRLEYS